MQKIVLNETYVSQQEDVKNLFLTTNKNLYLKKGSTGIGGTTVILEATDCDRIVVSPTVGMIQGKEKQNSIKNKNCYFIYGGSTDKWDDFFNNPFNKVVNCTPDQIINLKERSKSQYNKLLNISIFVDEIHQYIPDSSYRNSMSDFLNIIFNDWKANWILSTATDNSVNGTLLDIPPGKIYNAYEIVKPNKENKKIEVLRSSKRLETNTILEIFNNALLKGRKLLIATNRTDLHKKLSKLIGYNVINLVGQNIETKMRPVKDLDKLDEIDWLKVDIVMISSKYFAGFDVPLNVDVLIDTNPYITSNLISPNDVVQIIGRSRLSVDRIVLHIHLYKPDIEINTLYKPKLVSSGVNDFIDSINNKVQQITKDNWFELTEEIISDFAHYSMIFAKILKPALARYGFIEVKYDNSKLEHLLTVQSWPFHLQMEKLLKTDYTTLSYDFKKITKYLRYKTDGIFSPDLAILFYTAILIKNRKINCKVNKSDKPARFYLKLNKLFNNDDTWNLLYSYFKTKLYIKQTKKIPKHSEFDKKYLDYLEIRSLPSLDIIENSNGAFSCFKTCIDILQSKNINLTNTDNEFIKLQKRCNDVYQYKDVSEIKTKNQLLSLVGWANLFVLNGGQESYNFPLKRNREYNPLTMIPGPLRGMMGIKLVEIDIKQANPTFIDGIIGSNLSKTVYHNIETIFKCNREQAKVLYNTYLNNDKAEPYRVYQFFIKIGYTKDQSQLLTDMVTSRKGLVYDKMTEYERKIIEEYAELFLGNLNWFRFHDAIVIPENQIIGYELPDNYNGVGFGFKYYNDGSSYKKCDEDELFFSELFDF